MSNMYMKVIEAISKPPMERREFELQSLLPWFQKKSDLFRHLKPESKTDKNTISGYIRLFEPLVIKALKQYTITSCLELQRQVLSLLTQLVQLRVNYCLLDSDQIFIGFVIKQFEYVEEGQIRNSDTLIPYIFNFLVLLSYEKYHSKSVIMMPKVIQLCDGIMASGLNPVTHAIPALEPVVFDLFMSRISLKAEISKDIDTQREVVVSMLLRLIQYYQVIDMLIVVLNQYKKESEEKWKRLSRQVVDMVLPLLARQQMAIDSQQGLDVIHRLFEVVAPSVFRPVDLLLKKLFAPPQDLSSTHGVSRWLSAVLAILRVLMSQSKEEMILSRLQEINLPINIHSDSIEHHRANKTRSRVTNDVTNEQQPPEEIYARFLLQSIGLTSEEIADNLKHCHGTDLNENHQFVCQQESHLLLYSMHMFQSGLFRKVTNAAMKIIRQETPAKFYSIHQLNNTFHKIGHAYPTLMLQWCNILILLNFEDQIWWSRVLQTPVKYDATPGGQHMTATHCCNLEVVRRGGLILFCDYVVENLTDAEHLTWLIVNHVNDIIELCHEPPVQDFISAIHRNSAASGLLVQAIHSRCQNLSKPIIAKRTLECLRPVHVCQSGSLLTLLIDQFLATHHLAVARLCDSIACRRLEMLLAENTQECESQLPLEDIEKLLEFIRLNNLDKRHQRLTSLLVKLRTVVCQGSKDSLELESPNPLANPAINLREIVVDKNLFLALTQDMCLTPNPNSSEPKECAIFLQLLDHTNILNIMMTKEFNTSVLSQCIAYGLDKTFDAMKEPAHPRYSLTPEIKLDSKTEPQFDPLFQAAQHTLLYHIDVVSSMLPSPHLVLTPKILTVQEGGKARKSKETFYREQIEDMFTDKDWVQDTNNLVQALLFYLTSLHDLPWKVEVPKTSAQSICRFTVMTIEVFHWMFLKETLPGSENLQTTFDLLTAVLNNPTLNSVFIAEENASWTCSIVEMTYQFLHGMLKLPGESLIDSNMKETIKGSPKHTASGFQDLLKACDHTAELVFFLKSLTNPDTDCSIPNFLKKSLTTVIISLSRLPLLNSYARTPPLVWKMGWNPTPEGAFHTQLPPLTSDFIQEKDVLKDFIYRFNKIGWKNRLQFEETWMNLLSVLCPIAQPEDAEITLSPEEEIDKNQCIVLAVKGITSLLIQSSLTPTSGDPCNSVYEHMPRNKPLVFLQSKCGQKLTRVRQLVDSAVHGNLTRNHWTVSCDNNIDRVPESKEYTLGQISIEAIWSLTGMLDLERSGSMKSNDSQGVEVTQNGLAPIQQHQQVPMIILDTRQRSASLSGLDIHSCLQFLLDLYGQWLSSNISPPTPLMLINEAVKSIVILSDLFTERNQFEWMFEVMSELHRIHPTEDELTHQYLVVAISKSAAIINLDSNMIERVTKMIDTCLKSAHQSTKVATLYGCLYILESGMSEQAKIIIPMVADYLLKQLSSGSCIHANSQQHMMVMLATAVYLMENFQEELRESNFSQTILQSLLTIASSSDEMVTISVYMAILQGLERLVLAGVCSPDDVETVIKFSVDRLGHPSPRRTLAALGLMLTCMYTGKQVDQWTPSSSVSEGLTDHGTPYRPINHDPESLIAAMERVTVLFERLRKGLPYEARVLAKILPQFLLDFFPPQDIMNKVIGEFLSNQQPHTQLLAQVVFEVFRSLHERKQDTLVRDWVMLSLSNFTQRTPISIAIWSLTNFFIAASTSRLFRCLFHYNLGRMGKMETIDRRLFVLSALDFRQQLTDESQQKSFHLTISSVAHPGTPYSDLMDYCS